MIRILAKIELENEIMRRTAEAERRAEELRLKEAEEKARVEQVYPTCLLLKLTCMK